MTDASKELREKYQGWNYLTPGMIGEIHALITERLLLLLRRMERDGQIKPFPGNKGPSSPSPSELREFLDSRESS